MPERLAASPASGEGLPRIRVRRVYDPIDNNQGARVLVDRVWPRGLSKERLHAELWLREAAPSDALRRWFGHEPGRWEAFKSRYFAELQAKPEIVQMLLDLAGTRGLTLLFSARDNEHNQAVALRDYLLSLSK